MQHCADCGFQNEQEAKFCGHCGRDLHKDSTGTTLVGTTIAGRYAVKGVIASGGMGVVYEAEQLLGDNRRNVAIKVLLPELSNDPTVLSRFNRECGIVAQLSHQNTVRVYDFGSTEEGILFIAMEYVRGQSLAAAIAQGNMGLPRALGIIEQMCHALHEAHELGIVHRDLKPDNVILARHGDHPDFVKILDFGIAIRLSAGGRHETKLTQKGMVLGTPPYMSPEQFTGAQVTRKSDIYSLGLILYECLLGVLPFEADSPWMWAQRHLTAPPPELPPSFPPSVAAAVRAALAKDPKDRPSTALDFLGLLKGQPSQLPHSGGNGRTQIDPAFVEAPAPMQPSGAPVPTANIATPITEMGVPPLVMTVGVQAVQGVAAPNPMVAPIPFPQIERPRRSRRVGLRWLVASVLFVAAGAGVWLAYWYDLFDDLFPDDTPPLPSFAAAATSTPSTALPGVVSPTDANRSQDSPVSTPVLISPGPASIGHTRTNPGSPGTNGVPSAATTAPAASATNTPATGWPSNWPTLPSALPPIPSALPSLPTAILGIPLPPVFQQPSPAAPLDSTAPNRP